MARLNWTRILVWGGVALGVIVFWTLALIGASAVFGWVA